MKDKIDKGDIVDVFFNTADAIYDVEVLYTPCATGDCFTLKDKKGTIYNVQQYNYMIKHSEG